MKFKNFEKRAFAFGLALSLVVTGGSLESKPAVAAKKPKLSKSKLTIVKGKTATLTVKNANKKVKWSVNKRKIARVTKKSGKKKETATIRGIKPGKAIVTAKVGKKKLKCTVKVKKPVPNFKSVSVDSFDQNCLVLKLKKKDKTLKVTDLDVAVKENSNGSYNKKVNVGKVVAVNSKQYRVYLQDGQKIDAGTYVQITSGISKATTQFKPVFFAEEDEVDILRKKGDIVNTNLDLKSYFTNAIGEIKLSVKNGSLPDGLTLDTKNSVVKGIPTTVGNSTVTFNAQDEMGRTAKLKVNFGIYDDTSISVESGETTIKWNQQVEEAAKAWAEANATNFDADKKYEQRWQYTIEPKGGSGSYLFTLDTPDNADVRLSTDKISDDAAKTVTKKSASSSTLKIPYSITKGDHTYTVNITDVADPTRTCTATIDVSVVNYYNLTGIVKSTNGQPITGAYVEFIPSKAKTLRDAFTSRTTNTANGGNYVGAGTESSTITGQYIDDDDDDYDSTDTVVTSAPVVTGSTSTPVNTSSSDSDNSSTSSGTTTIYTDDTSDTPSLVKTTSIGSYDIELPADTYTVKVYGDVKYEMTKKIKMGKKDSLASVVVPERFYSVSANTTYSGKVNQLKNKVICFEASNSQYERTAGGDFNIRTNEEGSFNIYLPANTYTCYIYDEKGNRKYFSKTITVTNKDQIISSMEASIARYSVEGIVYNSTSIDAQTQYAEKMKDVQLWFFNEKGLCVAKTTTDDEQGHYKVFLEPNATYTVKVLYAKVFRMLGTVAVTQENQENVNLTYTVDNDKAGAVAYASNPLAADSIINSVGGNNVMWSFTPVADGRYSFYVTTGVDNGALVQILDENLQYCRGNEYVVENDRSQKEVRIKDVPMEANRTYYIKVFPKGIINNTYLPQAQGEVKLVVTANIPVATQAPGTVTPGESSPVPAPGTMAPAPGTVTVPPTGLPAIATVTPSQSPATSVTGSGIH